jgi:hypothetical protein
LIPLPLPPCLRWPARPPACLPACSLRLEAASLLFFTSCLSMCQRLEHLLLRFSGLDDSAEDLLASHIW